MYIGILNGIMFVSWKFGLITKTNVQNYRMSMEEVEGIVYESKFSTCQNFMGYVLLRRILH
jgi:hypothetical protein